MTSAWLKRQRFAIISTIVRFYVLGCQVCKKRTNVRILLTEAEVCEIEDWSDAVARQPLTAMPNERNRMTAEDIKVQRHDSWIEVTIDRPEKLNAIREQTAVEILEVMNEVEAGRQFRGLILTGNDKAFCTGVDTSEQKNEPDEAFELWRRRKRSRKVNQLIRA